MKQDILIQSEKLEVADLVKLFDPLPCEKPDDQRSLHYATIKGDGGTRDVVLKAIPRRAIISECVGLLVARRLGLKTLAGWLVPFENRLAFATAKADIQTIKEAGIGYQDNYWQKGVGEEWFRQAFVFDAFVGNFDRVLRNMCFLGSAPNGEFVFMDHDKILSNDQWQPETLHQTKALPGHNNLVRFLPLANKDAKNAILRCAQTWQKDLSGETFEFLDQMVDLGLAKNDELDAVKAFLTHRARAMTPLVFSYLNLGAKGES